MPNSSPWQEYRLDSLDLPERIVEMIRSLQPPSPTDSEILEGTLRRYQKALEGIRSVLALEGQDASHMAHGLLHVEAIARYRVMACTSVKASWRKLPMELWDKIFMFYLDNIRIQVRRDNSTRWKVPPQPRSYLYYGVQVREPTFPSHFTPPRDGVQIDLAGMNAPRSLLRVCQAWEAAVLSTPSIWADVSISTVARETAIGTIPFVVSSDASRVVSRLRRVLVKPTAWSLTIREKPGPQSSEWEPSPGDGFPLSSVLLQAETPFSSVERLKIIAQPAYSPHLGQINFRSTTSLVLLRHGEASQEHIGRVPRVPSLMKAVLINAIELSASQISPNIPWSQLTHLLIGNKLVGSHIRGLLTLCTSLRQASFRVQQGGYGFDTAWYQALVAKRPTLSLLESLDIIASPARDEYRHLGVPLVNMSFPALTKMRLFGPYDHSGRLANYLQPFHNLTHLSLVACVCRGLAVAHYSMGVVLDSCPLLVELVASVQGVLEPILQALVFHHDRPRGRHLQVLALLSDLGDYVITPQPWDSVPAAPDLRTPIRDLIASRRQSISPALLDRFILRFTDDINFARFHVDKGGIVDNLKKLIEDSVQPFTDAGLQLSVESTSQRFTEFDPMPTEQHWDEGALDFLDGCWEYTASLPPQKNWLEPEDYMGWSL